MTPDRRHNYLPARTLTDAMTLIGAVHDNGPHEVAAILQPLNRQQLYSLAVTLAAMVPDDKTPTQLLAWNDRDPVLPFPRPTGVTDRSQRAFQLLRGSA